MPSRAPGPGEQYRFHFDMRRCIGCKCCVVACNEQNGNPAAINWRRVGEIEGGSYPNALRSYLSMGCNHCVNPTCLSGCPVDAYTKDPATGIVHHSADACIGCQYCTWNCSYGVPQYNPERGVVGKCDMCHGRLEHGQAPACVSACPEGAIQIEIVKTADWRAAVAASAGGDGGPIDDGSLSTTRVTLPAHLPPDARPVGLTHLSPEHAHWSLVMMTVLTQLSVGAFVTIWVLQLFGATDASGRGGADVAARGGSRAERRDPSPRTPGVRLSRAEDVAAVLAESRGAAVHGVLGRRRTVRCAALDGASRQPDCRRTDVAARDRRRHRQRVHLSRAIPPSLEHAPDAGAVQPDGRRARAAPRRGARRERCPRARARRRRHGRCATRVRRVALRAPGRRETHRTARHGAAPVDDAQTAFHYARRHARRRAASRCRSWPPVRRRGGLRSLVALSAEILGRYLFFVSVVPKHMAAPYLQIGSEAA